MTDGEFILFLVGLLWNDISDGEMPTEAEFNIIRTELENRHIDPDEYMGY